MAEKKIRLRKVGKRPAADAVAEDVPHIDGVLAKDLRRILLTSDDLRGARGMRGPLGETGRRGRRGLKGETIVGPAGDTGATGKSIVGPVGPVGPQGDVREVTGPQGAAGPQGPRGNVPAHKWAGTKLSFEQPDGSFGRAVNLQGPGGGRGGVGNAVKETWQDIRLDGTDLVFEKLTAGPLGKSTVVDLSSLAGGGGTTVDALTVEPILGDILTLEQSGAAPDRIADTSNFLWKLGKPGSQVANGGTLAGEFLVLRGSAHADRGRNVLGGGANILWDWTTDAVTAGGLYFNNVIPASGNLVSAQITLRNTIGVNSGVFIMSAVDDNSTLTWSVAPTFAVTTLFFARQVYRSLTPGIAPAQALIFSAQSQYWITGAGDVTTINYKAVSFAPIIRTDQSGDRMRITNVTGISVGPLYNTRNVNSTADFGTIRGTHMLNAATVLFGQGIGTEIASNWIGLDVEALTGLSVSGVRAAVRSRIPALANNYLIQNLGGAESDFLFGDIHLNDDTWLKLGNTLADPDVIIGWTPAQSALVFSTFFGAGNNPLYLRNSGDTWTFQQNTGGALDVGLGFNVNAVSFGVVVPTPNAMNWFVRFEGPNNRQAHSAGVYSDVWWTAGGTIDVNGLALTEVNSFRIDANVTALNGGTVQDQSGLFIAGMGFPGSGAATRIQSLRVTGRARLDGRINLGSDARPQITANQNNYQLAASNSQRTIVLLDSDAAYNITGFDVSIGFGQTGDTMKLINIGAFALTLTHQDVLSLAANRIITSTGVAYIIGPGDMVELWYDDTGTARWRMLAGTGA